MVWLPNGEESLMIYLLVSTELRRVMDGQTEILQYHSPRYAQHRAVKLPNIRSGILVVQHGDISAMSTITKIQVLIFVLYVQFQQ